LLLLIFNEIAGNFNDDDDEIMPWVKAMIALDNFLVDNAVLLSYHVCMVCEKTANRVSIQTTNVLPPTAAVFPTNGLQAGTVTPKPTGLITDHAFTERNRLGVASNAGWADQPQHSEVGRTMASRDRQVTGT
jgi:hypothetical protein